MKTVDETQEARLERLERELAAERAKNERLCAALAAASAVTGRALDLCTT